MMMMTVAAVVFRRVDFFRKLWKNPENFHSNLSVSNHSNGNVHLSVC